MRGLFCLLLWFGVITTSHAQPLSLCRDVATAAERTEADVWREMGLHYSLLRMFVSNELAPESPHFLMALVSLNSLLERQNRVLLPASYDLTKLPPGRVVFSQNEALVYEYETAPDLRALWLSARPTWKELSLTPKKIDFDRLFEWVIPRSSRTDESLHTVQALNEALNENDPHSRLEPDETRQIIEQSVGIQVKGIGIQLGVDNDRAWIAGFPPGGKAEREGFRMGDEFLAIEGKSVRGLAMAEISSHLQGEIGTRKNITVSRNGRTMEIETTIVELVSPIVWGHSANIDGGEVGILKVRHFSSEKVVEQAIQEIKAFEQQKVKGIVLDLRNNPGGDVDVTIAFLGLFLGRGRHIMTTVELDGASPQAIYTKTDKITDLPLIVLVNQASASGAEVAAASLQQTQRALVVGETTFGKGTVQRFGKPDPQGPFAGLPLHVYQTRAIYYVPPGKSPQIYGVPPDFVAHFKPNATKEELAIPREADLYNAYPNKLGPLEPPARKDREEIRRCLQSFGTADRQYYSTRHNDLGHDYQMLVAADVMRCLWRL